MTGTMEARAPVVGASEQTETSRRGGLGERSVPLRAVMYVFVALTFVIAATTPAYEANDEPDHMLNVQKLVDGRWYRIEPGAGYEPHQPPLYYLGLAAYQKAIGLPPSFQDPEGQEGTVADGIYTHDHADAQRRYQFLRLPSILLGLATVYLTFRLALLAGLRRHEAVATAALVAFLPRFTFLSSVVNNDNLANTLGAVVLLLGFTCMARLSSGVAPSWRLLGGLGVAAGAALLTKLSIAPMLAVMAALIMWTARRTGHTARTAVAGVVAAAVSAPLFISNHLRYGDPLAARESVDQFKPWVPSLVDVNHSFDWYVKQVGSGFLHSFWYTSGVNQFRWNSLVYVPLWAMAVLGIVGAFVGHRFRLAGRHGGGEPGAGTTAETGGTATSVMSPGRLLALWLAGVAAVWILATSTTQYQARVSYPALPAFAILVMLGFRRLRIPRWCAWVLPIVCLLGVLYAIRFDIIGRYYFEIPPI